MRGNDDSDLSCETDLTTTINFNWKIKGLKGETCETNIFTFKIPGHMDSKWMMEIKPGTIVSEDGDWCPIKISIHSINPGTINVRLCSYVSSETRVVRPYMNSKDSHVHWRIFM